MERVVGIEPTSPAWKAGVIAFIRYPQAIDLYPFLNHYSFIFTHQFWLAQLWHNCHLNEWKYGQSLV
jgi:hypothetical protein